MRLVRLLPFILLFLNLSCSKSSLFEIYTLFNPKLKAAKNRIDESIGREAEFSFRLVADSSRHSLSAFKGKTIFLNFWAPGAPLVLLKFRKSIRFSHTMGISLLSLEFPMKTPKN